MKVIEYLKEYGLEKLNQEYGVITKIYDEGLIVLNYDQINSPKNDITSECRGLILDREFKVVSRSFDRFFNYGENFATFDPNKAIAYEKIDGSLIKIYNWKGTWYVSTRGTAFAESGVNGWGITFKDMVFRALKVDTEKAFQELCEGNLDKNTTTLCEIVGVQNRVVTRYEEEKLYYLHTRDNNTGEHFYDRVGALFLGCLFPKNFTFNSIESCIETAKHLPDLQEGYVMYEYGVPVCKVKSPAYVAVHHIRGEGLNPKRIAELVVINEQDEYLKYFPEDEKHFIPYIGALQYSLKEAQHIYSKNKDIESQKEFALAINGEYCNGLLFTARKLKEDSIIKVFNAQETNYKVKYLLGLLGEDNA